MAKQRKKLTEEEKKERARLSERRRKERIRNDPEKYACLKARDRERYMRKISQLTPEELEIIRKKNREISRMYYARKKKNKLGILQSGSEEENNGEKVKKLTEDEKKEQRRLWARRRKERIRNDPEKYALWKANDRERKRRRRREEQEKIRKKNRESSKKNSARKKKNICIVQLESEEEIYSEKVKVESIELDDPLGILLPQTQREIKLPSPSSVKIESHAVLPDDTTSNLSPRVTRSMVAENVRPKSDNESESMSYNHKISPILSIESESVSYNHKISPRLSMSPSPTHSLPESSGFMSHKGSRDLNSSSPNRLNETDPIVLPDENGSHWKRILRKVKHRSRKELELKDKQIIELKIANENYRKEIKRLKSLLKLKRNTANKLQNVEKITSYQRS